MSLTPMSTYEASTPMGPPAGFSMTYGSTSEAKKAPVSNPRVMKRRVEETSQHVHGAHRRPKLTKKALPPYRWMTEQLEKKLADLEKELETVTVLEDKLLKRDELRKAKAERECSRVEGEIASLEAEIKAVEEHLQAVEALYAKKDTVLSQRYEKLAGKNRDAKEMIQLNIGAMQRRYQEAWRENHNLKRYRDTGAYWSKNQPKKIQDVQEDDDLLATANFMEENLVDGGFESFGQNNSFPEDDDFLMDMNIAGKGDDDDFLTFDDPPATGEANTNLDDGLDDGVDEDIGLDDDEFLDDILDEDA